MQRNLLGFDFYRPSAPDEAWLIECPAVDPFREQSYSVPSRRDGGVRAQGIIAVAQSRVVYQVALDALSVRHGYEIERRLLGAVYAADGERPRWWDRLAKGVLRIGPALERRDTETLKWISILREHTELADWILLHPLWALCDPAPKDVAWLLAQAESLRARGVQAGTLCSRGPIDAVRLYRQVRAWPYADDLVGSTASLVYTCHLARALADPASYAIAFSAWADSLNRGAWWRNFPGASEIILMVLTLFGRAWPRPPMNWGAWAGTIDLIKAGGGRVEEMTGESWRRRDAEAWLTREGYRVFR